MKFAVFALIAGLCLIASASAGTVVQFEDIDLEFVSQELDDGDLMEFEDFGIWTGFKKALKASLQTLKALNCVIKYVDTIKEASQNYVADIKACGGQVSKQVQTLLNQLDKIIQICVSIGTTNDETCNNANYNDETDSGTKSTAACIKQMFKQVLNLKVQIKKALAMMKKLPKVAGDSKDCGVEAGNVLLQVFTQFPSNIKSCSQLTSK